jgi:hypothetical protein
MFFKTFSIVAIAFGAVCNAGPLVNTQEGFSLAARGPGQSKEAAACTVEDAVGAAAIKSLNGNGLFYTGFSLPKVQALQKKSGRKTIMEVFPQDVRDQIAVVCGKTGDPWEVMSKAMAGMASGDTWVLKATAGHGSEEGMGKYWDMEYAVMAKLKTAKLHRVNENGEIQEELAFA